MIKLFLTAFLGTLVAGLQWYDEVLGIPANTVQEYQNLASGEGATKFILIEFYGKHCPYCEKFYPVWNKIVKYYEYAYQGQMIFVKIDGDENVLTQMRYGVKGNPGYVIVEPGTDGDKFARWDSKHKDR